MIFKVVVVPIAFLELVVASPYLKLITMLKVLLSFSFQKDVVLYECLIIPFSELP